MHVMGGGDVGGAKTQIMNTVTGLSRNNDVMLISFRAGPFADEARERGIDVRVIERHNPFRAARTMRNLVDAFKPDIIHCHGGRANLMGAMVRRSRQVPIVTTVPAGLPRQSAQAVHARHGECHRAALSRLLSAGRRPYGAHAHRAWL